VRALPPSAQRVVDVRSVDPMPGMLRSIHEELVWHAAAALEHGERGDRLWITHRHPATLARLRHEVEMNRRASQRHVLAPERREPNVAVVLGVAVPPDPEQPDVEQSDCQSERPIALAMARAEQAPRDGSYPRQLGREV